MPLIFPPLPVPGLVASGDAGAVFVATDGSLIPSVHVVAITAEPGDEYELDETRTVPDPPRAPVHLAERRCTISIVASLSRRDLGDVTIGSGYLTTTAAAQALATASTTLAGIPAGSIDWRTLEARLELALDVDDEGRPRPGVF